MSVTDRQAQALKPGETITEKVGKRGEGVMLLVNRGSGTVGYYRYTAPDETRPWIDLGHLSKTNPLQFMRDRAGELSRLRREHPDLKGWLEADAAREMAENEARRMTELREAARGSFAELLKDYVANLRIKGRVSAGTVDKLFARLVYEAPLGQKKARDVTPQDITSILGKLSSKGSKVHRNRARSYLHAAFAFGLRAEHDETRASGRTFGLDGNPVAVIPPLAGVEREGTRTIGDVDLRALFAGIDKVEETHRILPVLLKFLVAIGGQRPEQVLAVPWSDYDLAARTIRIIDRKGRAARPRVHLVPLTNRALDLLAIARSINPPDGEHPKSHPFIARGNRPIVAGSLKGAIAAFRKSEHGVGVAHFSGRDVRRTAKQIMTRAGIRREWRNLLQNHGQTGVDARHYDNDPEAHLPEKRRAMLAYDEALGRLLAGKEIGGGAEVVQLKAAGDAVA